MLLALQDKPITPSAISEKTKIYPSHVSITLTELTEQKLVKCLTPKLRKGRLYDLTNEGRKLLNHLT